MAGRGRGSLATSGAALVLALACGAAGEAVFDGERAFADLRSQVEIGPRPSGSEGARRTRGLIRDRLDTAGWGVHAQTFRVTPPDGGAAVEMTNLIAERKGRSSRLLLIGAHYDTKRFEFEFVGANDGASGTALLLELARALGPEPGAATIWLCFFDGEEAFGPSITRSDGLYGSRELARIMQADRSLARVHALILVDMIADRDLNLAVDLRSSPRLRKRFADLAREAGHPALVDAKAALHLVDDHTPFLESGLREVLALIDFQFGARSMPGPLWHTSRDDLAAVAPESLNTVGKLVVQLVVSLDAEIGAREP